MKLASRIGTIATAGIVTWASVGAAQPGVEEQSQAESASPSTEPVPSVSQESGTAQESSSPEAEETDAEVDDDTEEPLPPAPSDEESENPLDPVQCQVVEVQDDTATIEILDAAQGDLVEAGETTTSVDGASQVEISVSGPTSLELTLWHGEHQPVGACTVQVSEEEPTDNPSGPETPPATEDPEPSETETTTPPPEEPTTPTETPAEPTETPTADRPGSAPPPPTSQAPPPPPSTPQQTPPLDETPQAPAPPPAATSEEGSNQTVTPTPSSSSQQTEPAERDIRQYSHNPRYLLSQLWGTDSHNGSRLIMPQPRDAENQSPDLETVPPVSEDELNAIKARHSSSEEGHGLGLDDELVTGDETEGLSTAGSVWLLSGGVCSVLVAVGIWWAISRRKPKH